MRRLFTLSVFLTAALSSMSQSQRTVLLELSESTWIQDNSLLMCTKENIRSVFGNDVAMISYHWDDVVNGGDPMFKQFAEQWALTFNIGDWGTAAIDRVAYDGTNLTSLDPSVWSDTIAARLNRPTLGLLTMPELLYDPATNEIFVRGQMDFTEGFIDNKEMRFFCYLLEDGIIADQVVDTLSLGSCTLFSDTLDTFPDFAHKDVAIANPSTYEGTDGIFPPQASIGNRFHGIYTFSKPAADIADLRVVMFVAEYNNADMTKNKVINAAQGNVFIEYNSADPNDVNHPDNINNTNSRFHPDNWPTGFGEHANAFQVNVYPNPVSDLGIVAFNLPSAQRVAVSLIDMQGREVLNIYDQQLAAGPHKAAFTTRNIEPGMYIARIQGNGFVRQANVVVTH